ncbi:class II histone deacetylase [Elongatibacter sediminis]|uniref:Class II histone deacetylase n=1 Tax=Elongatibacter sediminis TaxID=3119006 RepID=A0AAW9RKZ6_9GAMM
MRHGSRTSRDDQQEEPLNPESPSLDVFWHDDILLHDTGEGVFEDAPSPLMYAQEPHPENATRLLNVKAILERGPLRSRIRWNTAAPASEDQIHRFHTRTYTDCVREADTRGPLRLDGAGTVAGPGTWRAAMRAAGLSIAATDSVLSGESRAAYALVRPPGHHAQPGQADGSCIFNNVGIAAHHALDRGVKRIAIVDWDQHHGNGTQEGFYDDDRVLTVSIHMPHGCWGENHPQRGTVDEVGEGAGIGYNLNLPVAYGAGDACYDEVMRLAVRPVIDEFAPELILVACGQDANQFDPNGRSLLTMRGFRELGRQVRAWAAAHASNRLVLFQEGGYAVTYTAFCAHATLEGVLGVDSGLRDPAAYYDQSGAGTSINPGEILKTWRECIENSRRNPGPTNP